MYRFIYLFIFSSIYLNTFSQSLHISGKVTDSLNRPLSFANIVIKPNDTIRSNIFVITDENGVYEFSLKAKEKYDVTVYFIGYKPYSFIIDNPEKDRVINIVMKENINQLDEVVIEADLPLSVKEDTINYKVSKFINGRERKLKDVIKKLPGLEVNRKGEVRVMGEKVNILLVDNKPFFSGTTKLGVENIPSDVIDEIEVLQDYNSISFMKGLNNKKIIALNIKLKKDKKKFYFGDLSLGYGTTSSYIGQANIFHYSPQTRMNFIGGMNNIGKDILTLSDFMSMTDFSSLDFRMLDDLNSTFKNLLKFSGSNYYTQKTPKISAFQIQNTFKNNVDLNSYLIYGNIKNQTHKHQEKYFLINSISQAVNNVSSKQSSIGLGKIGIKKTFNSGNMLRVNSNIYFSNHTLNEEILLNTNSNTDDVYKNSQMKDFSFDNNIQWYRKFNLYHILNVKMQFKTANTTLLDNWKSSYFYLDDIIDFEPDSSLNLLQDNSNKNKKFMFESTYYYILNAKNHFYTTVGTIFSEEKYFNNTSQILSNQSAYSLLNGDFFNDVKRNINDAYMRFIYRKKISKINFNFGISIHNFYSNPEDKNLYLNKNLLLPEFTLKTKLRYTQDLVFNYRTYFNKPKLNELLDGYMFNDYASLYRGNLQLLSFENLINKFSLKYKNYKLSRGFLYYFRIYYSYNPKPKSQILYYYNTDFFKSPILLDKPKKTFSAQAFYKQIHSNWYASISLKSSLKKYNTSLQGIEKDIFSNTNFVIFKYGNKHDKWPNIDASLQLGLNQSVINNELNQYQSSIFTIDGNYEFLKNYYTTFSLDFIKNIQDNNTNTYNTSNFSLQYNNDISPLTFELKIKNILDNKYFQKYNINEVLINDYKAFVQRRLFIFKVIYKL